MPRDVNPANWNRLSKERKKVMDKMTETNSFIKFDDFVKNKNIIYNIHDNGGNPFDVVVNNRNIELYETIENYEDTRGDLFKCVEKYEGYWNGFDDSAYEDHGNSILIKKSKNKYIFVGWESFSFKTDDEIIDYVSTLGNSDVPYPIAFGEDYLYFMIEKKYVPKNEFKLAPTISNASALHGEYYQTKDLTRFDFRDVKMIHKRRWH